MAGDIQDVETWLRDPFGTGVSTYVCWGELLTPVRGLAERVDSSVVVALAWSGALVQEYALLLAALAFLGVVAAGDYLVERLRGQTRLFSV
jgi:hypothetical protein